MALNTVFQLAAHDRAELDQASTLLMLPELVVNDGNRGQPGGATETISMYMYNGAFVYFRMGYIAAAALIVLVLVTSISIAIAKPLRRHN